MKPLFMQDVKDLQSPFKRRYKPGTIRRWLGITVGILFLFAAYSAVGQSAYLEGRKSMVAEKRAAYEQGKEDALQAMRSGASGLEVASLCAGWWFGETDHNKAKRRICGVQS